MVRRIVFMVFTAVIILATLAFSADDRYVRLTRISYIEGNVSYQRAPEVDWSAASINMPLEPGDRIYTGSNGRLEIEFEDDSVLRLAENTDVEFLSLNDDRVQIRMLVGLATLTVSSNSDFEVNTPAAAFNTVRKGIYRLNVDENGVSSAIVRSGKIEAANNFFTRSVDAHQRISIRPGADENREVMAYDKQDAWDEWTDRRVIDRKAYASRSYLPDTVYMGAAELDRYGRWINVGAYGWAWVPNSVDSYWSPYSVGRWCYRPLLGWTWISYEPWGWLPYHYGRWYQNASFGWVWIPGESFAFNFWSPGLVAFYQGAGWISWCPLGPGDYYNLDHYHYNRGIYGYQVERLRRLHSREPGDFFNRNARGAFRTVDLDRFRDGSFHERNTDNRWGNIDRPWKDGAFVHDKLKLSPDPTSYKAAPDRPVARPRMDREHPVVVRSDPSRENSRDRDRFEKITNPRIPTAPSRWSPGGREGNNNDNRRESEKPESPKSNSPRWSIDRDTPRPTMDNRDRGDRGQPQNRPQPESMVPGPSGRTATDPVISNEERLAPRNNARRQNEQPTIITPRPSEPPASSEPQRGNRTFGSPDRIVPEPRQGNPPSEPTPSRWRIGGRSDQSSPSEEIRKERPSDRPDKTFEKPQEKPNSDSKSDPKSESNRYSRSKEDKRDSSDKDKDRRK
jgi:hypothetical protein